MLDIAQQGWHYCLRCDCAAPGPKGGKRLTRAQAFETLRPFIWPQSGFVRRILDHDGIGKEKVATIMTPLAPVSGNSVRLRHNLLHLLKVIFSAPGNPFINEKANTGTP